MLFSLNWLRELCPAGDDAQAVAATLTSRGLTVDAVEPGEGDTALDVDVPANRPDCLGHLGLARELAAACGVPLAALPDPPPAGGAPVGDEVRVEIADPGLCPRYTARVVRGVRVGPSPEPVRRRLTTCGLRPINAVVDASNLVLLALGHPIHFFDLARLRDGGGGPVTIRVRPAVAGETLTTLDGEARRLDPQVLVIADARRPRALAGVIGGDDSEIGETTRDVLIEAAAFAPAAVRHAARRFGLATEASYRFERGVDAGGAPAAQQLAVVLLAQLAGGTPAPGMADLEPAPAEPARLSLRRDRLQRLLGFLPGEEETLEALERVGLAPRLDGDGERITVTVPGWRRDLEREADLIEEVARHVGYDRVPVTVPGDAADTGGDDRRRLEERVRDLLAGAGFHEAFGYSMIGEGEDDPFAGDGAPPALALSNPIAEPLARLRRSLLPGLVRAADLNLRRGTLDTRLFEVGRVFLAGDRGGFPAEPLRAGLVWAGAGRPRHWSEPDRPVDLEDATGLVTSLLADLAPGTAFPREPGGPAALHPGRSARWIAGSGAPVAWAGALHPDLQARFDHPLYVAELDVDHLQGLPGRTARYRPISRLPAVTRDLSLVLSRQTTYRRLLEVLRSVDPPVPVRFDAVDRYEGRQLGAERVSLTVRATLEPHQQTLTDPETEGYRQALIEALERDLGATIRA